jgi:hypothetical protein
MTNKYKYFLALVLVSTNNPQDDWIEYSKLDKEYPDYETAFRASRRRNRTIDPTLRNTRAWVVDYKRDNLMNLEQLNGKRKEVKLS